MRLAICLLALAAAGCSRTVSVVTYNVQNVFDDVHDANEYDRYVPGPEWGTEQFYARCRAVSEVLKRIARGGPDVAVLQEIENARVVDVLCDRFLAACGYTHRVVTRAPDSPINIAVISKFAILDVRTHTTTDVDGGWTSRPVLEVGIDLKGCELRLIAAHLKSKRGGARDTEPRRRLEAMLIGRVVDERLRASPASDVLVAGDLNESHDEQRRVGSAYPSALATDGDRVILAGRLSSLASPWVEWLNEAAGFAGSYAWEGEWLTHDHFLLSPGLLSGKGLRYARGSFRVCAPDFLLDRAGLPRGAENSRERGYSDHLPLIIDLRIEPS